MQARCKVDSSFFTWKLSVDDEYGKDYEYYNDDAESPNKVETQPHHSKLGIHGSKINRLTTLISGVWNPNSGSLVKWLDSGYTSGRKPTSEHNDVNPYFQFLKST